MLTNLKSIIKEDMWFYQQKIFRKKTPSGGGGNGMIIKLKPKHPWYSMRFLISDLMNDKSMKMTSFFNAVTQKYFTFTN